QHAFGKDVDQHEVCVSAAGDDAEALAIECLGHGSGIGDDLTGVVAERRLQRLFESDGFGGDDVNERSALVSGKDVLVNCGRELLVTEDEAGAWPSKCLVSCAGDDLRVWNRGWMHAPSDQSGEVCHINDEDGAAFVGDGAHAGKIERPWVGAAPTDDY